MEYFFNKGRPAVYEKRLTLTRDGRVRFVLKTPYRDATLDVIFEPVDYPGRRRSCQDGIRD